MVVKGAAIALKRHPGLRFLMVGDEPRLRALMKRRKKLLAATEFLHTDEVVPGTMRPSVALRQGRKSSMGLALRAVRGKPCQRCRLGREYRCADGDGGG